MRKLIGLIAAGLVLSAAGAKAQEASRRAVAEELLNVMNAQETIEKSFEVIKQMIPTQMQRMEQASGHTTPSPDAAKQASKMMEIMAKEFGWDKLKGEFISLYAEVFTEEEMKGIIAFYKSPAGQAFNKKQPELTKRSMELSQRLMMQVVPKIRAMVEETGEQAPAPSVQPKDK